MQTPHNGLFRQYPPLLALFCLSIVRFRSISTDALDSLAEVIPRVEPKRKVLLFDLNSRENLLPLVAGGFQELTIGCSQGG